MSDRASKICGMTGGVIAVAFFHFVFARDMFPPVPGSEINYGWDRAIVSALVGTIGFGVGALFSRVVERLNK